MHQYTVTAVVLGLVVVLISASSSSALAISCPLNNPQEASAYERRLCYAIEKAIDENGVPVDQCMYN